MALLFAPGAPPAWVPLILATMDPGLSPLPLATVKSPLFEPVPPASACVSMLLRRPDLPPSTPIVGPDEALSEGPEIAPAEAPEIPTDPRAAPAIPAGPEEVAPLWLPSRRDGAPVARLLDERAEVNWPASRTADAPATPSATLAAERLPRASEAEPPPAGPLFGSEGAVIFGSTD